jgi:hypothetical protein
LSAGSSTEQEGDLPLNAWAGGKWPTLEEMAKALMDGKLALAADNAAAGEASEDEARTAETFNTTPACSRIKGSCQNYFYRHSSKGSQEQWKSASSKTGNRLKALPVKRPPAKREQRLPTILAAPP